MNINAKITILTSREGTTIELYDVTSGVTFARIKMTSVQFCSALGRLAYTETESAEVYLENVGKKLELSTIEFQMPDDFSEGHSREIAKQRAKDFAPTGWTCDDYFGSQGSFFSKSGKNYARATIKRWVEAIE